MQIYETNPNRRINNGQASHEMPRRRCNNNKTLELESPSRNFGRNKNSDRIVMLREEERKSTCNRRMDGVIAGKNRRKIYIWIEVISAWYKHAGVFGPGVAVPNLRWICRWTPDLLLLIMIMKAFGNKMNEWMQGLAR